MKFEIGDAVCLGATGTAMQRVVSLHLPEGCVSIEPVGGQGGPVKWPEKDIVFADPVLQFFRWSHLPYHLQQVSQPFGGLAHDLVMSLPDNTQRLFALQRLIEAKDAAVRARIFE